MTKSTKINLENTYVFISGPMTEYPLCNAEAFTRAHALCKLAGVKFAYNPGQLWLNEPRDMSDKRSHESYMQECLEELTRLKPNKQEPLYDYLIQLDNWEKSPGASVEAICAESIGIQCISEHDIYIPKRYKKILKSKKK